MSCWYGLNGEVTVRDTRKSRKVLSELDEIIGEIESEVVDDAEAKTFTLKLSGGMSCSYSTASDIDDKLKEFGPFAVGVGYFETNCDDEKNDLWVGEEKAVAQAIRESLVREASAAIAKLTPDEKAKLGILTPATVKLLSSLLAGFQENSSYDDYKEHDGWTDEEYAAAVGELNAAAKVV